MELGVRAAWAYSVSNLGLEPYFGPKYVTFDASLDFHRTKAMLFPTRGATSEPGQNDWLSQWIVSHTFWAHGAWNGSEVLCGIPFERVAHHHGVGEHSHTEWRDEPRTCIVARIDPPLLLGFFFAQPTDLFTSGFASIDPPRASALLAPMTGDGSDVAAQIANARARGMRVRITDSSVSVVADEIHSRDIASLLDGTALIAQRLAYVRSRLPRSQAEGAILAAWSQVASARGLTLDADRFTVTGTLGGYAVTAALYVLDGRFHTDVRTRLARPLSEVRSVEVRRATTTDGLFGWLSSDRVDIGDASLAVAGTPVAGVRALLGGGALAHVHALLTVAHGLSIAGDNLWTHFTAPLDASTLDRALAEVATLAAILTPPPTATPYR